MQPVSLLAMTMTRLSFLTLTISLLAISSCETFKEISGLMKPEMDNNIVIETPDLILPPDFNTPLSQQTVRREVQPQDTIAIEQYKYPNAVQSASPRITNYLAPKINIPSSNTPSDSLEKFKENKKFTIGEWVYGQYIDSFRKGNLYYRPVYDKGYNFSRRYVPENNVFSFQQPEQNNQFSPLNENFSQPKQTEINTLDQLPILE